MDQFWNPVHTVVGDGAAAETADVLRQMGAQGKNVLLLVWNNALLEREEFAGLLSSRDFQATPYCFQASNPTVGQLFATYRQTRELKPAAVVAIGGRSILDVG